VPPAKIGKTTPAPPPVSARAESWRDRTRALLIAVLVACATLPYLNTLFNGFVYDDDTQLVKNPYIRSFQYLKEIFTTDVWSFRNAENVTNCYRPMMTLGYLFCYRLFGLRAYGFHLANLLLHALIVCLIFVLTERLTGDRLWAFVAGALFALHPVHTESVAWIAAVTDLEVTFFYLLTFGIFLEVARPRGGRSLPMLAAMLCAFILALLSKEQAMTLPALATVYEHFYRRDREETSAFQKLARYGPLWLFLVSYVLFRVHVLGTLAPVMRQITPRQIVLSALALLGQYVGKLLWPVRLCVFYVFHVSNSLFNLGVLAGLLALLALAGVFLVCWRSRDPNVHFASFGIVWFFATLAPVLNAHMLAGNVFAERYLYLPSVGIAWLVGLGASKLWRLAGPHPAQRWALALACVLVGGLYAARIVIRDRDFNNDVVLYTQTLQVSPDADGILNDLASAYWFRGELDNAESLWKRVLGVNPENFEALSNLGVLALRKKQYPQATELFQRAIKIRPDQPNPHLNLGETYLRMGLRDQAEPPLRMAVSLAPLNPRGHNKLGQLLFEEGRDDEAEEQFRASLGVEPTALAYDYLGAIHTRQGAPGEAEQDFRAALSLDGSNSDAHCGLGHLDKAAGRKPEALREYQACLVKDPANPEALAAVRDLGRQSAGAAP
jgi:tetratricopeptide (TPR) repeat protein